MSVERNELLTVMNEMVRDIFDHYDDYTETEQKNIKKALKGLYLLNSTLDKYDEKELNSNRFKDWFKNFLELH